MQTTDSRSLSAPTVDDEQFTFEPLTVFFSLPFRSAESRSLHLWGHIALNVEGTTYQIFDPGALRAPFFVSRMPTTQWLYGTSRRWVHRDPADPKYGHVYLYGVGEALRTTVYHAGVRASESQRRQIRNSFAAMDDRFIESAVGFHFRQSNCSSIVARVLSEAGVIAHDRRDNVPFAFFSRVVRESSSENAKINARRTERFCVRRFCVGSGLRDPEKRMDARIAEARDRARRQSTWRYVSDCVPIRMDRSDESSEHREEYKGGIR